jgi:DNA end-binding protein Ku
MVPRSSWKGHLRLSLVTVPVQAINAEGGEDGEVNLHQLHAECNSRIQYRKFCPLHGEVSNDEIVLGYEHAKDQYVVVEKQEARSRKLGDRSINIDTFVAPEAIDPMYFDGSAYYLIPDGEVAEKPYAVLLRALTAEKQVGVGTGTFWGRERLVAVRPVEDVLCLQMLR